MKRTICVITGTRAEYGLLKSVIGQIRAADDLALHLVVTGTHLSPEFGNTIDEIEADGFEVHDRIEILLSSDTATGVSKAVGLGVISFAELFARARPDILLVLGDRFEMMAAAVAAMIARIPIAHIAGGERTEGAVDEAIRHAITKMAHLHFVGAASYRDRVVQLGEAPDRVFLVGGLGVDAIQRVPLITREALEQDLQFEFGGRSLLITFHPPTLDGHECEQLDALLKALAQLDPNVALLFTMPNADSGGRVMSGKIKDFAHSRPNSLFVRSLGQLRYLSCMQFVDAVVGNSSSGLAETPSFKIGTVDIGDRQKGRLMASSVVHCQPDAQSIGHALSTVLSDEFKATLGHVVNPYGPGGASEAIVKILNETALEGLIHKTFYDLPNTQSPSGDIS